MSERQSQAPSCIYRLADSLDSILAACEDLVTQSLEPSSALRLELAAVTHVLQARRLVDEFDPIQLELMDQCTLFRAGTSPFAPEHFGRGKLSGVFGGNHRSEEPMIGNAMPIRVLAHLAASMLDALEGCYVLYPELCIRVLRGRLRRIWNCEAATG